METLICLYLFFGFTYMIIQASITDKMNTWTLIDFIAACGALLTCLLFWPVCIYLAKPKIK